MTENDGDVGVVAIGRNEGERLKRCLRSVPEGIPVIYVDSASTDGSKEFAVETGAMIVDLDLAKPFTAARARNEGAAHLLSNHSHCRYIQFVDGDCELEEGWINHARAVLTDSGELAAVCGRRRERYPDASLFNKLCDEEWDTPIGLAEACGGDALVRAEAFRAVGGYDPSLIAGEEPEMCFRMRAAGWEIRRLDLPMTIHDADMHILRQWWMRAVRSGFGYAQGWEATADSSRPPLYRRETLRAIFWTCGVVGIALVAALIFGPAGLVLMPLIWMAQFGRLAIRSGWQRASLQLLSKPAEAIGIGRFLLGKIRRKRSGAIFYK